jgi:hypothetical protein
MMKTTGSSGLRAKAASMVTLFFGDTVGCARVAPTL